MRAAITTLDDRLLSFSADDAELSWHVFGGPMLANLPAELSETDIANMRIGSLRVDGRWGGCWNGFVTAAHTSKVEGAGLNLGLSLMRHRGWPLCINQTEGMQSEEWSPTGRTPKRGFHRVKVKKKGWVKRKDDEQNGSIQAEATNDAIRFKLSKDQNYWANSYASMLIELDTTSDCTVNFAWARPDTTNYNLSVYVGVPAPTRTDGDRWTWTEAWTQAAGSGATSGTASVHSTTAGVTAVLLWMRVPGSYTPDADKVVKFTAVKVYGTSVTTVTPANIIGLALDEASDLVDTTARDIATGESAVEPFDTDGTPLDLLSFALTQTGGRFAWLPKRTRTASQWRPTYSLADETIAYDIYSPDSELSAVDIEEAGTHAEVAYAAPDGGTLTLQRSTTTGYLGKWGVEKWIEVDAMHTTSATHAAALGDLALAEAAYDRHAGSVSVEVIRDTNGVEIPLEHVEYGRRVKLRTAGKTITPRITEGSLQDGVLRATLDDSRYALDIALANLARR